MDAVNRPADDDGRVALGILGELFRDRPVVGIDAVGRVLGFGALHCLTQRQPVSTEQPWGVPGNPCCHGGAKPSRKMSGRRMAVCGSSQSGAMCGGGYAAVRFRSRMAAKFIAHQYCAALCPLQKD